MERALSLTALTKRIGRTLVPITVLGLGIVMALPQSAYAAICPADDPLFANCSSCSITPGTGTVDEFGNAIPPQHYCSVTNSDGSRTDVVGGSDIGNSSTTRDPNGQITSQTHTAGTNETLPDIVKNGLLAVVLTPVAIISFVILSLASFLLWLAGVLFNWAVAYLVFDFGKWFGNSPGLLLAWRILRDFGNIILLYGFVYMGIATILDLHDYTVKKALPNLVIFAVLLNFSLFASQLIIDASNVFASTLYNQTYAEACGDGSREHCLQNTGIASQILQQAGIGSAFSTGTQSAYQEAMDVSAGNYLTNPIGETIKFFGLALLVMTAAVVLFAGALLLIARAIHLGFLMVTSPIGFAGMAVPPLQKIANDWWEQLINQALFAPVFLLLLFAALKITEGLQAMRNGASGLGNAISNGGSGDTGAIMLFALVIGFMIAALLMAKRFGVYGAEMVTDKALGVIKSTAAAPFTPYRDMAGAAAKNVQKRYNVMAGVNNAKFDAWAKKAGVFGTLVKPIVKGTAGVIDDAITDRLDDVQNIKVGSRSYKEQKEHAEERDKEMKHEAHEDHQREETEAGIKEALAGDPARLEKALQEMSVHDIEQTKYIKKGADGIEMLAEHMSPEKFEGLINSKEVEDDIKEKLTAARFRKLGEKHDAQIAIMRSATATDAEKAAAAAAVRDETKKLTVKEFEILAKSDAQRFEKLMSSVDGDERNLYSDEQYEALSKSNALTASQKTTVKKQHVIGRMEAILESGAAPTPTQINVINRMKPAQKARMSDKALLAAANGELLNVRDLGAIVTRGEIEPATNTEITRYINRIANRTPIIPVGGTTDEMKESFSKYRDTPVARSFWVP